MIYPLPQMTRGTVQRKEEIPLKIKSTSTDQATPSKGTQPEKRDRTKEEGMETNPSPNEKKE
jgi:hypothetical protein